MSVKGKKKKSDKQIYTTPEERKLLAESYLRWVNEYGTDVEKEDIVEIDGKIFILGGCAEDENEDNRGDYGGLDLESIGYTPEEIEQGLIRSGYYKYNKSAKHFIDWFNEKFKRG